MAALLTEDKVLLLGFGNDELKLDLLPQHGRAEGERVKGALRQLQHTHTHTRIINTERLPLHIKSRSRCMYVSSGVPRFRDYTHLHGRACFTVVVTLLTVMKGVVGSEPAQAY